MLLNSNSQRLALPKEIEYSLHVIPCTQCNNFINSWPWIAIITDDCTSMHVDKYNMWQFNGFLVFFYNISKSQSIDPRAA